MPRLGNGISVFVLGVLVFAFTADAEKSLGEPKETERLLIAYDSSNSMWGELEDRSRKYEAGRTALSAFLETNLSHREIGFRAYGHRNKTDCRDSELIVPFSSADTAKTPINQAARNLS